MVPPLAILPFMLRHIGAFIAFLALLVAGYSQFGRLQSERALERCRGQKKLTELRLERAEAAVKALDRDSRRRAEEQKRLVSEAKQENDLRQSRIRALQSSAFTPRAGDGCALSEALRKAEKDL